MKKLIVLICTYNRAQLLHKALASLQDAERPHGWQTQILIVANACTDETHAVLNTAQASSIHDTKLIPVKWLEEPHPGKSYALNAAIPHLIDSDIVTFVDDDHCVDAHYLAEICRAADNHPEMTMFCGRILPDWDGTEPKWVHDEGPYKIRPLPIPRSDGGPLPKQIGGNDPTPGGGNLFLRCEVFGRVGDFPTDLGPRGHDLGGGEDSVFIQSALAQGERLMYIPGVVQYHYVDPQRLSLSYVLRKAYFRSRSLTTHHTRKEGVPLYIFRKLGEHVLRMVFSLSLSRSRYYLVRTATTLGELSGILQANRRPTPCKQEKRRTTTYYAINAALLAGIFSSATVSNVANTLTAFNTLILVSALFALVLSIKSITSFTYAGPRLHNGNLDQYRLYTLYAFLRLIAYAFLILALLAGPGILVYHTTVLLMVKQPSLIGGIFSGGASIVLICALQFSRHLLLLPANIAASYNYRLSRLYSYWRRLTPARLQAATFLLMAVVTGFLLVAAGIFLNRGMPFPAITLSTAVLFYACLGLWLRNPEPAPKIVAPRKGPPNIIMIGSDTLRADRLDGKYGREVAPYLRSLSKRGVLFTNCYVPCARTAPSLASLLTGTWPHHHRVRDNFVTDEETHLDVDSLPRILRRHGYYSAALSDWCGADMGKFNFDFDYTDLPEDQWNIKYFIRQGPKDLRLFLSLFARNRFGKQFLPEIYYLGGVPLTDNMGVDAKRLINNLAARQQPFFLNIFLSTTHGPFGSEYPYYTKYSDPAYAGESKFVMARLTDPFEIIRRQGAPKEEFDLDQIINLYDGCVTRFDVEARRIIEHLEHCDLADNTVVVIYSDHGMEFFEHDTWGQGNSATSDVSNRVPLLILAPGNPRTGTIADPVRSIDVAPTLLQLAGFPPSKGMDGVSLSDCLQDTRKGVELDVFGETGIWLTELPGTPKGHLRYPDLLDLLTVQDTSSGTISIKPEYAELVIRAKDRMVHRGRWKLVYQPLENGHLLKLFNMETDPGCKLDVGGVNPDVVRELWSTLRSWIESDRLMET